MRIKCSNQTEEMPTLKALKAWHKKIVTKGSWIDGAFFHWQIKAVWYIVEYCSPIGEETYFKMYREDPCAIRIG